MLTTDVNSGRVIINNSPNMYGALIANISSH